MKRRKNETNIELRWKRSVVKRISLSSFFFKSKKMWIEKFYFYASLDSEQIFCSKNKICFEKEPL